MGNSKEITVTASSGESIVVKKLALGDYAALLRCLKSLPKELSRLFVGDDKDKADDAEKKSTFDLLIAEGPELIAANLSEFAAILAVVSDKDTDWYMQEADLADAIDVLGAALELNNYKRVIDTLKKLTAGREPNHPNPAKN
jgi:hypothetical protein